MRGQLRLRTHLPSELIEEVRDCVAALSGPPDRLNVSTMVETALRRELAHRKRKAGRKAGARFARAGPSRPNAESRRDLTPSRA